VRLFLDAHLSARRIARVLRQAGHDVRAADEERALDGWSDTDLLALAAREDRIMVTFNVHDFPRIAREWAEAGEQHAGCAILVGMDHSEYGTILRVLEGMLAARPQQEDWRDYTTFVSRRSASTPDSL
jgi:hypothetical protein